jgi:stearoyl-CoA 9-desaturase NADPH oxidoreductase
MPTLTSATAAAPATAPAATPTSRRPAGLPSRLLDAARWITTPLLPDDYLGLVDPLRGRDLRARVEQVVHEASGAATLVLRPGPAWTTHVPGQWVRVGVEIDGVLHWRSYSLTCPPREDGTLRITVKAVAGGFVSHHLVRRTRPGTVLRLEPAAGQFVLPTRCDSPLLFVTGGSGITPVMGMLRGLAAQGPLPDSVLVHSALHADDVIFGKELRALAAGHQRFTLLERHTDLDGLLRPADLDALVPDWRSRETWACGPAGLLDALEDHWQAAGRREALHTERFKAKVVASDGEGGSVAFTRSGAQADVDPATPLLEAGEAAGVLLPSGCRMGICFSCVVPLRSGQVRDLRTGRVHGDEGDLVQTCISTAAGACELDA